MIPLVVIVISGIVVVFAVIVMYLSVYWPSDEPECASKQAMLDSQ